MTIIRRFLAVSIVGVTLFAACGGDDESTNSTAGQSPSGDTTATTTGAVDAGIPDIADAAWNNGRIHLEVSGGVSSSFESDGTGTTTGGRTTMTFDKNDGKLATIILGEAEGAAISVSVDGVTTMGRFGIDCEISFTQNDSAGLAADFSCDDLNPVDASTTSSTISLTGNFRMAS
jgi:hypothetical protein